MKVDFGRWTTKKATLAVAGLLAIGGAIGSAVAFSPIVAPPIKWSGGVEFRADITSITNVRAYTVPAGRNLILTDFIASNDGALNHFSVYAGPAGACNLAGDTRLNFLIAPASENTVLAFQTGIGFSAGQAVCVTTTSTGNMRFHGRGFLFTPQPAS